MTARYFWKRTLRLFVLAIGIPTLAFEILLVVRFLVVR
jgi:hypothetical protein